MLFQVHMKSLYRHKRTGDIFAIETDDAGQVISTSEPLFGDDFNPKMLDYDEYLQRADYMELLRQNGFYHRP